MPPARAGGLRRSRAWRDRTIASVARQCWTMAVEARPHPSPFHMLRRCQGAPFPSPPLTARLGFHPRHFSSSARTSIGGICRRARRRRRSDCRIDPRPPQRPTRSNDRTEGARVCDSISRGVSRRPKWYQRWYHSRQESRLRGARHSRSLGAGRNRGDHATLCSSPPKASLNSERFRCWFGKHPNRCWARARGQRRIACDLTSPLLGDIWSRHTAT